MLRPNLRPPDSRRGVASPPGSRAPPVRSFFAPEDLEEAGAALVEALALLTQPEHAQRAAAHAWDDHFSRAPSSASQQSGTGARDWLRAEPHASGSELRASGNELDSDYASDEGAADDESLPPSPRCEQQDVPNTLVVSDTPVTSDARGHLRYRSGSGNDFSLALDGLAARDGGAAPHAGSPRRGGGGGPAPISGRAALRVGAADSALEEGLPEQKGHPPSPAEEGGAAQTGGAGAGAGADPVQAAG